MALSVMFVNDLSVLKGLPFILLSFRVVTLAYCSIKTEDTIDLKPYF